MGAERWSLVAQRAHTARPLHPGSPKGQGGGGGGQRSLEGPPPEPGLWLPLPCPLSGPPREALAQSTRGAWLWAWPQALARSLVGVWLHTVPWPPTLWEVPDLLDPGSLVCRGAFDGPFEGRHVTLRNRDLLKHSSVTFRDSEAQLHTAMQTHPGTDARGDLGWNLPAQRVRLDPRVSAASGAWREQSWGAPASHRKKRAFGGSSGCRPLCFSILSAGRF